MNDRLPPDYRALEPLTECEIIAIAMWLSDGELGTPEQKPFFESGKHKLLVCAGKALAAL